MYNRLVMKSLGTRLYASRTKPLRFFTPPKHSGIMNDIQLEIAAYLCRQVCASWLDSESNPSNEGRVVHCTVAVNYRDLSDQNQHRLVSLAAEIIKYILEFHQTKKFFVIF